MLKIGVLLPRFQVAKGFLWQDAVASHAEEQARSAQGPGESAAESGDDQNHAHGIKQERATDAAANIHESSFKIWKRPPVRPDPRAQIGFKCAAHSRENASEHDRERNVTLGILDVFGQSGHAVEADIGQRSKEVAVRMRCELNVAGL
jgi:hypothetical protein